jgi:hypothetical protein
LRRAKRYSITAAAEIDDARTGTRVTGRASDLSVTGCYIDTLNPLAEETEVRLQITYQSETFTTAGIVAYSAPHLGMGIEFVGLEQDQKDVLQRWVDQVAVTSS